MKTRTFSKELKEKFGCKVYKLSLTSGCTCPNRDGTLGVGGCTFCSEGGSGDFASPLLPLSEQIRLAKEKVAGKVGKGPHGYLAYFQPFTNTYGPTDKLESLFMEALSYPEILGLSIGTRPDCLEKDKIDLLARCQEVKPLWVELGLQTIHEETAQRIHRGYPLPVFEEAYAHLKEKKIPVVVHVILGLPGESREDMLETISYLSHLSPRLDGVKLQLLHVLRGTALADEYLAHPFPLPTLEEYASLLVDCLRLLPPKTVIHRLTGDGPKSLLIAPLWTGDKKRVLNTLRRVIAEAKR